jgi:hypothetical protein
VPYLSAAQMCCREEVGVSYVALGIFGAAKSTPLIAIRRNPAPFNINLVRSCWGRLKKKSPSWLISDFLIFRPSLLHGHPRGRGLSAQQVKIFLGARVNGIRATWLACPSKKLSQVNLLVMQIFFEEPQRRPMLATYYNRLHLKSESYGR